MLNKDFKKSRIFDIVSNCLYFEVEDGTMYKTMRATNILARFINKRPEYESCEAFSRRVGLPNTITVDLLNKRSDVYVGLAFQIAKAMGYQIMFYNPNPPDGLEKCYIVGEKDDKVKPRELKRGYTVHRDSYNNDIYRSVRKYRKKKKTFKRVGN